MRIDKIKLLSVPFDNSYRNVFSAISNDGTFIDDFKSTINNFLSDNFDYVEITSNIKNIRRTEMYINFNVLVPLDTDITKYNYVISYYNNQPTFWFINNIKEENCVNGINLYLVLELDVWNNYQNIIYNEEKPQFVENFHFNQIKKVQENNTVTNIEELPIYPFQDVNLDYIPNTFDSVGRFKILWANIKCLPSCNYKAWFTDVEQTVIGGISSWNDVDSGFNYCPASYHEFFFPIAVYDNAKWEKPLKLHEYTFVDHYGDAIVNERNRSFLTSDFIVSVRYTFNIPSKISIDNRSTEDRKYIVFKVEHGCVCSVYNGNTLLFGQVFGYNYKIPKISGDVFDVFNGNQEIYDASDFGLSTQFSAPTNYYTDSSYGDKFNVNSFRRTVPLFTRYPFVKKQIKLGGRDWVDIIPRRYIEDLSIKKTPNSEGTIYTITGGLRDGIVAYYNTDNSMCPELVETSSSLPVTENAYEVYMRNNGARVSTAKQEQMASINLNRERAGVLYKRGMRESASQVISGVSKVASGSASMYFSGGLVGGGSVSEGASQLKEGMMSARRTVEDYDYAMKKSEMEAHFVEENHNALLTDLANMKDISVAPQNGTLDIVYQDGIIVRSLSPSTAKPTVSDYETFFKYHLFGFTMKTYADIREFSMNRFVYIKTVDCSLTSKINLIIKRKIEDILNIGTRCWRIFDDKFIKEMNTDCPNYFNLEAIQ